MRGTVGCCTRAVHRGVCRRERGKAAGVHGGCLAAQIPVPVGALRVSACGRPASREPVGLLLCMARGIYTACGVHDMSAGCGPMIGDAGHEASIPRAGITGCLQDPSATMACPPGTAPCGQAGIQPPTALGHPGLSPPSLSLSPGAAATTRWPPRAPSQGLAGLSRSRHPSNRICSVMEESAFALLGGETGCRWGC